MVSRGKIKFKQAYTVGEAAPLRVNVPLQSLDGALNEILVFDSGGGILGRRLFFSRSAENITAKLNLSTSVDQRARISGSVQVLDESGRSVDSEVNVLVYQANLFKGHTKASSFYLSDLPAADERAQRYDISDNFLLNDFLITQIAGRFRLAGYTEQSTNTD